MLDFLKLGGSLITDKAAPQTPRLDVIKRLADEVAEAQRARPDIRLLLGHGSGSFGHAEARKHGTRPGVRSPNGWRGFAWVSAAAARLNRLVADALLDAGVPVVSFQPSASALCRDGEIVRLESDPIERALASGLAPLVYGDVAFDDVRGGTIISTEAIFRYLARHLRPARILLAGIEAGVYADWPEGRTVVPRVNRRNVSSWSAALEGSQAPDVTGGMASKVTEMLALAEATPGLQVIIFSGAVPGNLYSGLTGDTLSFGTTITAC